MTTYTTYKASFGKQNWTVIVASGKFNYVSLGKQTCLRVPFFKDFNSFEKAIENYKDTKIKLFLELISIGMISPSSNLIKA
jgi:hypothetical protein